MKKMIALAVVTAMIALCAPAHAAKHWDDMSWWGNTGATKAFAEGAHQCRQCGGAGGWRRVRGRGTR